jgi:hypothetical protein
MLGPKSNISLVSRSHSCAPLAPGWLVVEPEYGCVEIGERVEIDEARSDQRYAETDPLRDGAAEAVTDEQDAIALENDLGVLVQAMTPTYVSDHPARCQQHRTVSGPRRRSRRGHG